MEKQNTQLKNEKDVVAKAEKIVEQKANSEKAKKEQQKKVEEKKISKSDKSGIQKNSNNEKKSTDKNVGKSEGNISTKSAKPVVDDTKKTEKNNEIKNPKTNINTFNTVKNDSKITAEKVEKNTSTEKSTSNPQINKSTEKKSNTKKGIIIFVLLTLIILSTLSFIFGYITSKSDKIIYGIYINEVEVSDMTKSEAIKKLNSSYFQNMSEEITLKQGNYTKTLNLSDLKFSINTEDSVDTAFKIGRSETNIFAKNFKVITTFIQKEKLSVVTSHNEQCFDELVKTLNNEIPNKFVSASYKIDGETLIVENGTSGYKVNENELKNLIANSIFSNNKNIEIPVEYVECDKADIESIYNQVHKDPVDATFKKDPYEIIKEQDGIDFNITIEEAKQLASTNEKTFSIPLKITKPFVTVKSLPQEAFPDMLGTYTTNFASSSANRANNVILATKSINEFVLMPDEVFSYNETLGQRTAARGYKEAGVYSNGQVTTGIGGGICQVSSTLYNATLLADLEIVERTNHMFKPGYVPSGQDATVSWGAPDFKFKNNRSYPIKIVSSASGGVLTVSIYGLKGNNEYDIKVQSYEVGAIPFSTEYRDDPSMPSGSTRVIQGGSNGCKSVTYKIYYKDGVEVSKSVVSNDTYDPHNQIVARGSGEVAPTSTQDSEPQQTQSHEDSTNTVTTNDGDVTISF